MFVAGVPLVFAILILGKVVGEGVIFSQARVLQLRWLKDTCVACINTHESTGYA